MIGKTLGHYRVGEQLGRGGMGEVYLADDLNLNRKVALKFLPDIFTGDPERMARFEREAKLLASLNHPNIAAIYGLEQAEGKRFLVLELVEGETLAQRISKGPIPVEEALEVCRQIAEGLEAAHEKGVIHRDLKPANVMITEGDKVKILDFGLAKALSGEMQAVDSSQSPTLTEAMTRPGVILGTAAYMSPEQAKGKAVDKRADNWAFGCILYECLTGKRAFEGETVTETLASVLKNEPDWQALPEITPSGIRSLLRSCLQKEMSRRFRDAADVRIEIEEGISSPLSSEVPGAHAQPRAGLWRVIAAAVVCLIVGSIATGIAMWRLKFSSDSKPISRLSITLPTSQILQSLNTAMLALSPDGTKLAYVSSQEETQQIYLRRLDSFETKSIAGTEGGRNPLFSPDSQWLGFVAGRKLMKVPIQGGAPLPLVDDIPLPQGISWSENGTIIAAPAWGVDGLVQISEAGGSPTSVTRRNTDSEAHRFPQFLPGNQAILYTAWNRNVEDARIMVHSLKTGEEKILVKGFTDGRYVPTGHLVFARQGNLFAVPFDAKRLEVKGTPVPILEDLMQSTEGIAQFSISASGSLAYVRGGLGKKQRDLVWVDRNGKEQPLGVPNGSYSHFRLSPEGERIAVTIEGTNDEIWIYDIPSRRFNRLTFQGRNLDPIWTPDGKRITFRSNLERSPQLNLFWIPADGSGGVERLSASENPQVPYAWSPDGKLLAFAALHPTYGWDLWVLPLDKGRKAYPVLQTRFNELFASLSPDGRWIAYISDESGKTEIYVRPFPDLGGVRQVSTDGGTDPVWSRSGELFYRNGEKMTAVSFETVPAFKPGTPRILFERKFDHEVYRAYDVTPDGKRFLIIKPRETETVAQINIVLNWFEELKQRVPVK